MSIVKIKTHGDFSKTADWLNRIKNSDYLRILNEYGKRGVEALSAATPVDSGKTSRSWAYVIDKTGAGYKLSWLNTSENEGISIVILTQYGHATRNGGWVEGRDFINPALRPLFDQILEDLKKEVR